MGKAMVQDQAGAVGEEGVRVLAVGALIGEVDVAVAVAVVLMGMVMRKWMAPSTTSNPSALTHGPNWSGSWASRLHGVLLGSSAACHSPSHSRKYKFLLLLLLPHSKVVNSKLHPLHSRNNRCNSRAVGLWLHLALARCLLPLAPADLGCLCRRQSTQHLLLSKAVGKPRGAGWCWIWIVYVRRA